MVEQHLKNITWKENFPRENILRNPIRADNILKQDISVFVLL